MNHEPNCPLCGVGALEPCIYGRDMAYKGVNIHVEGLQYAYCPECEAEITMPAEMDSNAQLIRVAYQAERARVKAEQNLLTGEQIRAIRESLGITQRIAAKIFGGGPTAFSKYEAEEIVQNTAMDKLLRVADAMPSAFAWLADQAGEQEIASESMKRVFNELASILKRVRTPPPEQRTPSIIQGSYDSFVVINSANDRDYNNELLAA